MAIDGLSRSKLRKRFESTDKLWVILQIALIDLKRAERSRKYVVDMDYWADALGSTRRRVCLAGAVMTGIYLKETKSLCYNQGISGAAPDMFDGIDGLSAKFQALNLLRVGLVVGAYIDMWRCDRSCVPAEVTHLDRVVSGYRGSEGLWWKDIKALLRDLKKANL